MNKDHLGLLKKVKKIDGWLSDNEALLLYESVKYCSLTGKVVEIGSFKGKSTIAIASGLKESKPQQYVYAIDPHAGELFTNHKTVKPTFMEFKHNIVKCEVDKYIKPILKTSLAQAKSWKYPISLLFIDGLHDYHHTREDYLSWEKFVGNGGIIIFHDCFCGVKGVWQAVRENFLKANQLTGIGTVGSIVYGIRGNPGMIQRINNYFKIILMDIAEKIYQTNITGILKTFLIHRVIRLLIMHPLTISVYK